MSASVSILANGEKGNEFRVMNKFVALCVL